LKIEREDLEDRQVGITVELEDDRLARAMRVTAKRLSKNTKIPGFRPGKAPYDVLVRTFGEEVIFDEALEELGQEIYREAIEDMELEPYAMGSLDEVINRDPLILRYTVPLSPDVDLGAYMDLRHPYEEPQVEDETVDQVMENLRERQALIEPAERPAEVGDVVVADVKAELAEGEEGEDQVLLDDKGVSILVEEQTTWPIPGISEYLIGIEAGEKKEIEYTFPEDYESETLREKETTIEITCLEVKSRFIPEWSDDLAKNLGEYESLLDLRIKVREDLTNEAINQAETSHGREVVDQVVEGASVNYPPILLQQEINDMLRELSDRLRMQNLSLEDYMKIDNKSQEDLLEEITPTAEERLKRALVLGELITVENIKVDESEVDAEIETFLERFEDKSEKTRQLFDNPEGRRRITLDLLSDKAIKRLIAIAAGEGDKTNVTEIETEEEPEEVSDVIEDVSEEVSDEVHEETEQATDPSEE
jgi:trigger factor